MIDGKGVYQITIIDAGNTNEGIKYMTQPTVIELYTQYDEIVRSRIYCMIQDFDNAVNMTQDLSQEVWIRVMKNLDKMPENTNYGGWIKTIAKHLTIDHMRKIKSRKKYETVSDEQVSLADQSSRQQEDPLLEGYILHETITATFAHMRPVEALTSYFIANGYKHEEIPGIIEEKLGTIYQKSVIRSLLCKSKANFQTAYKQL